MSSHSQSHPSIPTDKSYRRFVTIVASVYALFWTALAIKPVYRDDWALENIVVAVAVFILIATRHQHAFSRCSYLLIALFLGLHAVGSHYTYSEVPYQQWVEYVTRNLSDSTGVIERNHYDRFVHFAYGLLLFYPFREWFLRFATVRWKFWTHLVPLSFVLSTSLIYELLEWAAAIVFGGDVGIAFLGSQGDTWDAQKDSFWALIGALAASGIHTSICILTKRDYPMEWVTKTRQGQQ